MEQLELSMPVIPAEVERRIGDAVESEKLSPAAAAVLVLLDEFQAAGSERALPIKRMQQVWLVRGSTVYSDRCVKAAVKELLEEHEVPVGSSRVTDASGYFLICTDDDRQKAARPLAGEIVSLAKRLRTIDPKSRYARLLMGQQELEA